MRRVSVQEITNVGKYRIDEIRSIIIHTSIESEVGLGIVECGRCNFLKTVATWFKSRRSLRFVLNARPHSFDVMFRLAQLGRNGFPRIPGSLVGFQETKLLLFIKSPRRGGTWRPRW